MNLPYPPERHMTLTPEQHQEMRDALKCLRIAKLKEVRAVYASYWIDELDYPEQAPVVERLNNTTQYMLNLCDAVLAEKG